MDIDQSDDAYIESERREGCRCSIRQRGKGAGFPSLHNDQEGPKGTERG